MYSPLTNWAPPLNYPILPKSCCFPRAHFSWVETTAPNTVIVICSKGSIQSLGNYIHDAKMLLIQASLVIRSPLQSAQKVCCSLLSHPFFTQLFGSCELFNCWDRRSLPYYYNSLWDVTVMPRTEMSLITNLSFYSWLPQPMSWERLSCSARNFSRCRRTIHYIKTYNLHEHWEATLYTQCREILSTWPLTAISLH